MIETWTECFFGHVYENGRRGCLYTDKDGVESCADCPHKMTKTEATENLKHPRMDRMDTLKIGLALNRIATMATDAELKKFKATLDEIEQIVMKYAG